MGVSEARGKSGRSFVKARHRRRSDGDLIRLMAEQARILAAIDATRRKRGLTVRAFAFAAGVGERSYRRAMSGLVLVRAGTVAKLRAAQRKVAAGYVK
jgi:hypothetical protein